MHHLFFLSYVMHPKNPILVAFGWCSFTHLFYFMEICGEVTLRSCCGLEMWWYVKPQAVFFFYLCTSALCVCNVSSCILKYWFADKKEKNNRGMVIMIHRWANWSFNLPTRTTQSQEYNYIMWACLLCSEMSSFSTCTLMSKQDWENVWFV